MTPQQQEPIAIVGSACRFPGGANSPSALWKLLESPRDVGSEIGPDRFDAQAFYHPDGSHHGTSNVLRSYLLQENVQSFDAAFFNLSPNEADSMDPQQRILLETVYETLEAGGHAMESLKGTDTAVYVGTMTADWNDTQIRDHNTIPNYHATGTNRAIISNRVSYFFDWHGPSMTIDTACSSSLVALHQGVQALRSGESRVAVACGTQVLLGPEMYIAESNLKMLSPNGRSAMWDASADGYARGEGVAAVMVKRLSDAIADGDRIECIVRETGVNQDGFSNGLTVPNSDAQTALIRQTYARAGLDPENVPADRPQFFEAHGTGTQAGDPKEAAAIHECFGRHITDAETPLYVGSVKTVIGHLEGCAGLAGVLKGSAMLQAGHFPPNMHFRHLNPKIQPFYKGLHVPTQLTPWPQLPEGGVRRVSVNSFGFGGTNSHAILEQYQPSPSTPKSDESSPSSISFSPFIFSASSELGLVSQLQAYSSHLKANHETLQPSDLAWTLSSRRSQLSTKAAFAASSIEQLASKIDARLAEVSSKPGETVGLRSNASGSAPRLLGVFTGQGAQWAAMGAQLIRSSPFVRQRIAHLEESLATLPSTDRPSWNLYTEMLAPDHLSRLSEAALSQPLCTAVQVVLVDLLRSAGITFAAVVGHSSGEIGAAYAAGFISAWDAIRIAYYRGFTAHLAGNKATGQKGAMMAVGTSWEDAQELADSPTFKGRIAAAAQNSPASVTLSGDADAILEAKSQFDKEKKFARLLKVDTAYHSHHMIPCCDLYVQSLKACNVQVNYQRADTSCTWYSSVTGSAKAMEPSDLLQAEYWRDNMLNAVLFAEAVKNAVANTDRLDLAIEVGPHPALKGPATQNIAEVQTASIPYCGALSRGKNDVEAFAEALGFVWVRFPYLVNFTSFEKFATNGVSSPELVKGLPSYQWNHTRSHWAESRISKRIRTRKHAFHEILGFLSPDSNAHDMRWLNVFKLKEVPWLAGHQLQGQIVFPAAGYVAMALEASRTYASDRPVELIELHQLTIPRAITFEEGDDSGVETLVTLTAIENVSDRSVTAEFACYSVPVLSSGSEHDMELSASGTVKIAFGTPDFATLPTTMLEDYKMTTVDAERFYATISELGYNYSGTFKTLSSAKRQLNRSSALVGSYPYGESTMSDYLVHPSMLDVAFHAAMLAYSAPGDRRLWSLMVPTSIGTIRVNPAVCTALPMSGSNVPVCATIDDDAENFSASIDLFSEDSQHGMVQVEDLMMSPFAPATAADDRVIFTSTKFDLATPNGVTLMNKARPSIEEMSVADACERIAYYHLRKWKADTAQTCDDGQPHWVNFLHWMESTLFAAACGQHPTLKKEWAEDTAEDIQALTIQHSESVDVKLLAAVDQHLPTAVKGNAALEQMISEDLLNDWYENGLGFAQYNSMLSAGMMKQVVHRYPHARILQLGAGPRGATKSILENVGHTCSTFTYTDRTDDSFTQAARDFKAYSEKMKFSVLDIEQSPVDQGFKPHSYDIIVASHTLTQTSSLEAALENVRSLLKPGGYLVMSEITNPGSVHHHNILSAIPGWWLTVDDARKASPLLTPGAWHFALRKAGFGGVDTRTPDTKGTAWPMSIMVSQAVDDRVRFLRRPLSSPSPAALAPFHIESLVILGNGSLETADLGEQVSEHLERFCGNITVLNGLPTEKESLSLDPTSTFLNLVDLDSPIFKEMNDDKMDGLKRMLELAKHIVWVTRGANQDQPFQMASLAFGRAIRQEAGHINYSHIDISDLQHNVAHAVAEYLVQQTILDDWAAPPSTLADPYHQDFEVLWSREPEVMLDSGKLMVPRLVKNTDQNARLNSANRVISKMVPIHKTNVGIVSPSEILAPVLVEQIQRDRKASLNGTTRVQSSSLRALYVAPETFLFLGVSEIKQNQFQAVLSTTNTCEVDPITSVSIPVHGAANLDADGLAVAVASELMAETLLRMLSSDSRVLVHASGKDRFLAAAITRSAATQGVRVTFTCDDGELERDPSWTLLNARIPTLNLRQMLRRVKPTHYLDLTAGATHDTLGNRIAQVLPSNCSPMGMSTLYQCESSLKPQTSRPELLLDRLTMAVYSAALFTSQVHDQVTSLDHVRALGHEHATSTIHWPTDGQVEVSVRPLDAQRLFSKDKTYLLVGLSGQIGQSLCEWMISNGAGCVCLTSRRPNVDQRWLDSFQGTGATVKVLAMDVLDRSSIASAVKEIRASCPPIAGVANGAVIFDDALFANMTGHTMRRVLGAKVDGSMALDETFFNDDLDFFILFSSIGCVYGNPGQSNYAAANGFLNALARQRRKRGLAASSLVLGMVAGIGHAESAGAAVQDQLVKKLGMPPISETDLRQLFAETIMTGTPRPEDRTSVPQVEVITGVREFSDDEGLNAAWFTNPYFSHLIKESRGAADFDGQDKQSMLPVSQRLAAATTEEETFDILQECFANKLRSLLQLGDQKIEYDAPLLELGIDSLVAVEVRSWFLKEVSVDIPVLKVVGGASLSELCTKAMEKLPKPAAAASEKQEKSAEPPKIATKQPESKPEAIVEPKKFSVGSTSPSSSDETSEASGSESGTATPATTAPSAAGSVLNLQKLGLVEAKQLARPVRKFLKSEHLSLQQSRFWFLQQLLEDPTTPNVIISWKVTGNVRVGDLERALRMVTNRHEALRTCFEEENSTDGAYQNILPSSPMRLERKKIESKQDVDTEYAKLRGHIFDLQHGDVMRLMLLTLSPSEHYLLINYHHIVMDGASFNVFFMDLEKAYMGQSLGPAPRQYPEFSVAQRRALENGDMLKELEYWRSVFPNDEQPPVLPLLPMARTSTRVPMNGFDTHQIVRQIDPSLVARVKSVSKANRSTPFHFHLAAFKTMLFCFAGDAKDLTIGFADAARNDSSVEKSIGFFLNLLTLRFRRQLSQTFADAIVEARTTAHAALETSSLPFDMLLSELKVARSSSHSPFFQAFLDYRQGSEEKRPFGNCQAEFQGVHPGRTAYDITLDVTDCNATDSIVAFRVQKSLYDMSAANLLLDTYVHLLDVVTSDPTVPLQATPLFGEHQLIQAVQVGRGPNMTSDWPATLPHRIDQVGKKHADSVALMDGAGKTLTYSDMSNRIEAISEALQNSGVGAGSRVLVYQQPAADWPCSMLAIMRLGAIYVPLDLRNPIVRLSAVAKDCEASAILADVTTLGEAPQLQHGDSQIINVSSLPTKATSSIEIRAQSDSPAAILYTSGSTGTPKGIMVTHAGLRNEIEGYTKQWSLGAERVLQQSAFTFNHSSDQMYTGLVNGGMVYIVPAEKRGDPMEITKILQQHSITYTKATPSEYSMWIRFGGETLRQASSWRFAFGGGESLTTITTDEFASLNLPELQFRNSYGPTEISISSHKMEIAYREHESLKSMSRIPCGYSLPNYYTYIVDEQLRPVPVGMPGEICIGGAGVSLGYLNNEELTNKCFVQNPFATSEDIARGWTRMYRTNDIGHLQEDGAMVFHSRMAGDSQVKIRGLRIELSDIESNIISAADGMLREAVVTLREGDPSFLVAHVVCTEKMVSDKESFLRNLLSRLPLPQYMIPVMAIPIEKFPLNNHSKVDRKAVLKLPLPERSSGSEEAVELSETMLQLKRVWKDVLGENMDKLGIQLSPSSDFFLLGGNSLLIIRLSERIRNVFHVVTPLFELLRDTTLGGMASKIEENLSVELIDWEQETAPPSIPHMLDNLPAKNTTATKTVLVTGATGFLGKYVLPQLAAREDVGTIHCVAVRDKVREGSLFTSDKVSYHVGDLSLPLLGLSTSEFRDLSGEVDIILHLGAVRSFWDNYHVLRPSNVNSIKELVKMAAPHQVPIHFISTVGVLPQEEVVTAENAGSAAAHVPSTEGSEGYVSSKWAGERILERSMETLGVPAHIYRFLPASSQLPSQRQELLNTFIRCIDTLGSKPDMSVWKGRIDLAPAEQVAQWLGDSVISVTNKTVFSHYESPVAVNTDELTAYIEQERGSKIDCPSVPILKWFGHCKAIGFNYVIASQQAKVGDGFSSRR